MELNFLSAMLIVIAALSITFIIGQFFLFGKNIETFAVKQDIYVLGNALEYGKIVADASFGYSFSQGCFDSLGKGGYNAPPLAHNGLVLWYDSGDKTPTKDEFLLELGKEIAAILNKYTAEPYQYLSALEVSIPKDYNIMFKETYSLEATATSPSFISVEKESSNQKVKLLKKSTLARAFPLNCLELFESQQKRGRQLGWGMEQAVAGEVNKWKKSGSEETAYKELFAEAGGNEVMGGPIFKELHVRAMEQAEKEIKTSLEASAVGLLPGKDGVYTITTEIVELSVDIQPVCKAERHTDDKDKATVSCDFVYDILFVMKAIVEDGREESKLPVFNGESVAFTAPRLVFGARIGKGVGSSISSLKLDGTFFFDIVLEDPQLSESGYPITLHMDGDSLAWEIPYQGATYSGTGTFELGEVRLDKVPVVIEGRTYFLSFLGTVGEKDIVGQVAGVSEKNVPVKGTFTTKSSLS
ncbi:MAG: hypothetical protein ISS93_02225 [Candidatus Aenigmarchaeota archaeon]|nr:hypothetical protein [Candidatus Aenigmarchaeota archaeon]